MAAEREPPPLGDVKPTDFEELEDGEDLFTSTVSTLEVRRPRRGGRAARLAAFPLPRLVPSPLPGLARPGPVTPVTPAAPQVPVKGAGLARAARPPDCSLRAWGATSSSRGRDPRTERRACGLSGLAGHSRLFLQAGGRLGPASRAPHPLWGFSSPGERGLFLCPGGCALQGDREVMY